MLNTKREIAEAVAESKSDTIALAKRRYPIGAELIGENKTHCRVWAPKAQQLDLVLEESAAKNAKRTFHPLESEEDGYFSGVANVGAGACYRFRINKAENFYPDPASRFQPDGPHGSSCVVDPTKFQWTDSHWPGVELKGQIIYEMHVGTFTREGTWRAAAEQLEELARIGISVIEMMPVADFPGKFGWGYDGVDLFAPTHLYGTPDDLRAFVNRAHSLGMGVILDVVYNHFGPDGNYLGVYSDSYLTREKENDWGDSVNFDGADSEPVREFFITNGRYWIEEFHFDGFRFDATQSILDNSDEYIVGAIGRAARKAAGARSIILVAENERQENKLIRPRGEGGDDLDAVWNDDFHHSAVVALSGRREAYYTDYLGSPQEFISAAKYGYLFQGQDYGASTPFVFFTDTGDGRMREAIRKGRFEFLAQFPSLASDEVQKRLPVPSNPEVFAESKLDFSERQKNKHFYDMHIDLLRLRREDSRFREQKRGGVDGAVLGAKSFVLRYFSDGNTDDRLLVVNLGERQALAPIPEPLLAPPLGLEWETLWSSESTRYGGPGVLTVATQDSWTLPAEAAVALRLVPEKAPRRQPRRRKLG